MDISQTMENHLEKNMENEMETGNDGEPPGKEHGK